MIKIKKRGDENKSQVQKYLNSNVSTFYLPTKDFTDLCAKLANDYKTELSTSAATQEEISICGNSLIYMRQACTKLGVGDKHFELVEATVEKYLTILKDDPILSGNLEVMLKSKGHVVSHSLTAAYICVYILDKLGMNDEIITKNLVAAAFFHDIGLQSMNTSHIFFIDGNTEYNGTSAREKKMVKNHALESAKILEKNSNFTDTAITIIKEHQELPNSQGYPRGVGSSYISFLGLIHITAIHIADHLYFNGESDSSIFRIIERIDKIGLNSGR